MAAKVETLSASSESSSEDFSDSSNSSPESDVESDADDEGVRTKRSKNDRKSFDQSSKDPLEEAKRYNQRYSLLMERINAINQVQFAGSFGSNLLSLSVNWQCSNCVASKSSNRNRTLN